MILLEVTVLLELLASAPQQGWTPSCPYGFRPGQHVMDKPPNISRRPCLRWSGQAIHFPAS